MVAWHHPFYAMSDLQGLTLEDGCAAFSKDTHNLAIQSLKTVGEVMKVADAISLINGN